MTTTTNSSNTTETTNDITRSLERATNIFSATLSFMMEMNIGDRMPVKKMAAEIGPSIDMEPADILPYVMDFARNNSMGYVSAGRFGGFVRSVNGERPLRKATNKKNIVEIATIDNEETITNTEEQSLEE